MKYTSLRVYYGSGETEIFRDVEVVCNDGTTLRFHHYTLFEPKRLVVVTFLKANLCGWSVTE